MAREGGQTERERERGRERGREREREGEGGRERMTVDGELSQIKKDQELFVCVAVGTRLHAYTLTRFTHDHTSLNKHTCVRKASGRLGKPRTNIDTTISR